MELYQRFQIPEWRAEILISEAVCQDLDVNGFYLMAKAQGIVPDYMPDDALGRFMTLFSVAFSHPDPSIRAGLLSLLSQLPVQDALTNGDGGKAVP